MPEDLDMNSLIDKLDNLKNIEEKAPVQEDPKEEKEKHVVAPQPQVNPNLTSNEKKRAQNFGTELFTGGMRPLTDIQKQQNEKKKMDPNKKSKGFNMKGFLGKMLGGLSKIFSIPLLIASLVASIPEIIDGVLKFLGKWFLPIALGIMAAIYMIKNPETWKKLRDKIVGIFKGIWDWLTGPGWTMLKKFFTDIWDWLTDPKTWDAVGKWVGSITDKIINGATSAFDEICKVLKDPKFWERVWAIVKWWFGLIIDVVIKEVKFVVGLYIKWIKLLLGFYKWLGIKILEGFAWVGKKIGGLFSWLYTYISNWWTKNISTPFSNWWNNSVVKPVNGLMNNITGWWNKLSNAVSTGWNNFINSVKALPGHIINTVTETITSIKNSFFSIIDSIKESFFGIVDDVKYSFSDGMSSTIDGILHSIPNALGGMSDAEYKKREKERAERAKKRTNPTPTPPVKKEVPKQLTTPQAAPVQGTIDIRDIKKLTQTEIDNAVNNNYNNSTNISNNTSAKSEVVTTPQNNVNIVPVTTKAPTVNVEAANDEIQHDLTKKQTAQIEELNSTMKTMAEKQENNSSNVTNMTVVNNNNGSNKSTVTMHSSANNKDAVRLRGASMY